MEPEEIDKLFRDKLAGRAAMPSPDAWMRLQQKMEPPKKERNLWIYYAAASVVILLVSGILYFKNGANPTGPAVATAPRVVLPLPSGPAPTPPAKESVTNKQPLQQVAQAPVATPESRNLKSKNPVLPARPRRMNPAVQTQERQSEAPALAAANPPASEKAPGDRQAAPAVALASAAPALSVVEVVVKREGGPVSSAETNLRENLSRKGHLLKNIYKQARNLKNGEPVELAALGVDKGRLQEETKELKQKLNNVISL
jgi:hypothetical protein